MLDTLKRIDTELFLFLNGKHTPFLDFIMYWASDQFIWIPFYGLLLAYMVYRLRRDSLYVIVAIALLITLSDQISSHLIKFLVRRPRPSHVEELAGMIHLSKAGPGGLYGFVSSHASNSFALALFFVLVLPRADRWLKILLLSWAVLVSYSRIYNGVHYPGDVLGGMVVGGGLALGMAWAYRSLNHRRLL